MNIRVLLAALIFLALSASVGISLLVERYLYPYVKSIEGVGVPSFLLEYLGFIPFPTFVILVTGLFISIIFFILVNTLIAQPLTRICMAMSAFAKSNEHLELPPFTASPTEIREFAKVFREFADRVEVTHTRDAEISRVKSDFISTAAHQLRTPLTGIRWALEALEKEALTDEQKLLVKNAVDKSHDLVAVVGTLLDISSIESGKYKYDLVTVDFRKLVEEVATDFLPLAKNAGVILTYEPVGILPSVTIDRERLKWVLNNLIENAIRYTPKGGSVNIVTESVSGRVMVRVRDTGIGIRDEDRNNIFERFYRAGNAIAKDNQGNGLGLYIARTIVNDHHGELSFEGNREGPGTTFTLALPASS